MQNSDYDVRAEQVLQESASTVYDIQKLLRDAIASVVYGHNPDVDFSPCTYQWGEVKYFHADPVWEPDSLYTVGYDNDSDSQDSFVFKKSESTTASFTWSITEGIKVGAKATVEVGIPKIADGKVQVSAELNVSSTQSHTESKTQVWEVNTNITMPARTHVDASMILKQGRQNASFEIDVICGGYANAYWNGPNGRVHGEASQAAFLHDYASVPYKSYTPPTGRDFRGEIVITVRGTFKGVQGVAIDILKKSRPIPHAQNSEALAGHLLVSEE